MTRIHISDVTEGVGIKEISRTLNLPNEESEIILNCLKELNPSKLVFNCYTEFPKSEPGCMQFMMLLKKYNINISKAVLSILSWLLGLVPILGDISSLSEFGKNLKDSVSLLSDEEKALIVCLRTLSHDGETELQISNIRRAFRKYARNNAFFKDEKNLNHALDSLSEKGLIIIKMETIQVVK